MQVFYVFSIYDQAALIFSEPFADRSVGLALRAFSDAINGVGAKGPTQYSTHPDDFDLYLIGEFSDSDGVFKPHMLNNDVHPKLIASGTTVLLKDKVSNVAA